MKRRSYDYMKTNWSDCKVSETGFVISQSHPFLGASPDGKVDGV